jgi:hypothetical protein
MSRGRGWCDRHMDARSILAGVLLFAVLLGGCDTVDTTRTYRIEGRVVSEGAGIGEVIVSVTGGASDVTSTDADGRFVFEELVSGRSYTVRPESDVYSFEPEQITIDNLSADRSLTFAATPLDEIVGGINLSQLFAPPSIAEIAAVESEWNTRSIQSAGYRVEYEREDDGATLSVISHIVDGNRHVALLRVPAGEDQLPVVVINHGGDSGIDAAEYLGYSDLLGDLLDAAILVLPAFRSESIRLDGETFPAEGNPSTWDRDVDDALGTLQVVLDNVPRADQQRIGTIGFSRGGGVSLLMAIRDPRIEVVVDFFGPTDFFDEYVRHLTRVIVSTQQFIVPGSEHLYDVIARRLQEGTGTMSEARLELVRRSPALFADRLPAVQIHHGTADFVVWVSQAHSLDAALRAEGRTSPSDDYELFIYNDAGHDPAALVGSFSRTAAFLLRHL